MHLEWRSSVFHPYILNIIYSSVKWPTLKLNPRPKLVVTYHNTVSNNSTYGGGVKVFFFGGGGV